MIIMIMTMIMMIMTYDHYDDLGSMIMILQNVITTWFKVYCPWPGYLDGGKVNTNRDHYHCRSHVALRLLPYLFSRGTWQVPKYLFSCGTMAGTQQTW